MYKYLIGVALCSLTLQANTDMQRGIYDAAEEMIRFDAKMSRAIMEHNQVGSEGFEETTRGYIFTKEMLNNILVSAKVENQILTIVISTQEDKDIYDAIEHSNISGFETIMNASSFSISIPKNADESKMEKSYRNGLLRIRFPKIK